MPISPSDCQLVYIVCSFYTAYVPTKAQPASDRNRQIWQIWQIWQISLCNSILVPYFRRIFVRTNLLKSVSTCGDMADTKMDVVHWPTKGWVGLHDMTRLSPWLRESALRDSKLSVREILDWLTKLSVCLSVCLCLSVCVCLSVYMSVSLFVCLPIYVSIGLLVCLSIDLSVCLSVCLSICFEAGSTFY